MTGCGLGPARKKFIARRLYNVYGYFITVDGLQLAVHGYNAAN